MAKRIIRSVIETIGMFSHGRFAEKCDKELKRVFEAFEASDTDEKSKAQLIVTIDITCIGGELKLKPSVKAKLPDERGFPATTFWLADGGMSVEHPSQLDMLGPRDAADRKTV